MKTGKSTYAQRRKVNGADRYGKPDANLMIHDVIAGSNVSYRVGGGR